MHIRSRLAAIVVAGGLVLTACSSPAEKSPSTDPSPSGSPTAQQDEASVFPAKVKSCDEELTFDKAPSKVVMLGDTSASVLAELGVLDKVAARAGVLREEAYSDETLDALLAIPEIASTELDTGGANVATEAILEVGADLVIGYDAGVDRDGLRAAGVPFYSPAAMCASYSVDEATFTLVDDEVTRLAAAFGVPEKGEGVVASLKEQVAALGGDSEKGTGAALYITPGSTTFYAYGRTSMVQPIFTANGLSNVYAEQSDRVFDASMEDLLQRNPDYLVLIYGDGKVEDAESTFATFNGVQELKAVKDGRVVAMAMPFTDPPSPTSVEGAVKLAELLQGK